VKSWVGACVALGIAGFVGAWVCLRTLLLPLVVVAVLGGGCATMERHQLATGTTVGTVVVSPAMWAGWYVLAGRPFARPVAVPQKPLPCEESWQWATVADEGERQRAAERAAAEAAVDLDEAAAAAGKLVQP
jgi:hypothetical protein